MPCAIVVFAVRSSDKEAWRRLATPWGVRADEVKSVPNFKLQFGRVQIQVMFGGSSVQPETRYTKIGDVHIAYHVFDEGPMWPLMLLPSLPHTS
jgi:hypothetical protein